jgi:catalase
VALIGKRLLIICLRWAGAALAVVAVLLLVAWLRDRAPGGAPMGEQVTKEEEFVTAQIISAAIDTSTQARTNLIESTRKPGYQPPSQPSTSPGFSAYHYTRDAHAKGSGCVLASFTVNKEVESRYSYGVFAQTGHTWDAIIRFSNGNPSIQSDSEKDPRGFAIKLMNVDGPKLLPYEEKGTTQDFIMMTSPVFFIRTINEYALFNRELAAGNIGESAIIRAYFLAGWKIWNWHVRELALALKSGISRPESLVTEQYYSASAYALGPRQYVKYSAIPCRENKAMPPSGEANRSPDYLRLELARQSEQGGACFDFAVQPQVLGKNMPVEDTTVEWKESDSAFVPLARIVIKQAKNNTEQINTQCENTAFNPWHSLPDHRPAGVMNRVRKALYQSMSRFRQQKNCSDSCDTKCNGLKWPDNGCAALQ